LPGKVPLSDIPTSVLLGVLAVLLGLSAFFSGSETGMMALNRFRLRHLNRIGHRGAAKVSALLLQPDRLIGVILLGNNFVNILATAIATIVSLRFFGDAGVVVATIALTPIILIFAEVMPKTLAALHPERIAFPAAYVLSFLLRITYPVVWVVNWLANGLLRPFTGTGPASTSETLSPDELRTVFQEAGVKISQRHRDMLVGILDLEQVGIEDIMVPRNEIHGLDLEDSEQELLEQVLTCQHTQLPIFRGDINAIEGVVHVRRLLEPVQHGTFDVATLLECAKEPYFTPLATPLSDQLRAFQQRQERIGLVVDEYGDIQGLVTLEDILEEIVGEFTTDPSNNSPDVHPQTDGTYFIDGSATVRELNRTMRWDFPEDGPKTLNGLILEQLEAIPEPGTSLLLNGYPVEIVQTTEHAVKTARVSPERRPQLAVGERVS
jgi:Mg2+/Co2+ transporter CorB